MQSLLSRLRLAALVIGSLAGASCSSPDGQTVLASDAPLHPDSREPALVSLHIDHGGSLSTSTDAAPRPIERLPLLVALWADGTLCWSADRRVGGAPYLIAQVTPALVADVTGRMHSILDPAPTRGRSYRVPDSPYEALVLVDATTVVGLESCIDRFEQDPRLVATDHGIESLDGRERSAVLAGQSSALRTFRSTWNESVGLVWSAVPREGAPLRVDHFDYARR